MTRGLTFGSANERSLTDEEIAKQEECLPELGSNIDLSLEPIYEVVESEESVVITSTNPSHVADATTVAERSLNSS